MPLRDVLTPRPRILFVGINPSLRSEAVGHHFASPGNPFWRLLFDARLVPKPLTFEDDRKLAGFGLALTNLCPRATRAASELTRQEIETGRLALDRKIRRLRPGIVALVGITLYAQVLGKDRLGASGPGLKPDRLRDARVFVLPNPSGLNASYPSFAAKRKWFRKLALLPSSYLPPRPEESSSPGDMSRVTCRAEGRLPPRRKSRLKITGGGTPARSRSA